MAPSPTSPPSPFGIPTLHVSEIELPREFGRLYDLAYNLWWAWNEDASDLFGAIDPTHWAHYRNPVQLLLNVTPRRWYPLLESESFRHHYERVVTAFDAYMESRDTWFRRTHGGDDDPAPIAYFSMEFGLHQSLAVYSGGLGVLSGDHCKSVSDLGIPFVAIGLLYRHGYFQQTIDADGVQQHSYPDYDFSRLPLRPVADSRGRSIVIGVPFPGREVLARVWLAQVGRVPLLLLDTDLPENDPSDRPICNQLYVSGREMRLAQEVLLGRGGVRVLEELGIDPGVWHLNEGHSAFLQLERLRSFVRRGASLDDATETIRANAIFTTHTPVPAGNEQFDPNLVVKYLRDLADEVGLGVEGLLDAGRAREGETSFNLTALAVRTSSFQNGVSRLNGRIASDMWRHLYPEGTDEPISSITNGIHSATWIGREMRELFEEHLGRDWQGRLLDPPSWDAILEIPDEAVWKAHQAQKRRLGRFTRGRLLHQFARHGAAPDELRSVGALFDERALTIGFARRFATYKRASLVFSDPDRLRALVSEADRPVQFVFAGKAHPADRPGQELIQRIFRLTREDGFRGRVFFLENYDMRMGRMLVQGVDVWLNTPRRPMEASGTSGQKAAMNGALNFSILDGWWPEGWNGDNGWVIGEETGGRDEADQDRADVESLYGTLESEIAPLFFDRGEDLLPRGWIRAMKESIRTLTPQFSAHRMVRDYLELGYLPAAMRRRG